MDVALRCQFAGKRPQRSHFQGFHLLPGFVTDEVTLSQEEVFFHTCVVELQQAAVECYAGCPKEERYIQWSISCCRTCLAKICHTPCSDTRVYKKSPCCTFPSLCSEHLPSGRVLSKEVS